MSKRYNPYQVICTDMCKLSDKCEDDCLFKPKSLVKGCNYSKKNDCKYCSHRNKCDLIKPYSKKLDELERKRIHLEKENKQLYGFISEWKHIENNLDKYEDANSVLDVLYFPKYRNNIGKMVEEIHDNEKLIEDYLNAEERIINELKG